jgi:hypothetical protein
MDLEEMFPGSPQKAQRVWLLKRIKEVMKLLGIEEFSKKYGDCEILTMLINANGAEIFSKNLEQLTNQLTQLVNYNGNAAEL